MFSWSVEKNMQGGVPGRLLEVIGPSRQHCPGVMKEKPQEPQEGQPIFRPIFRTETSEYKAVALLLHQNSQCQHVYAHTKPSMEIILFKGPIQSKLNCAV
jgi:hypothetical protein